jgi:thiamine-monophosphate kinase
MKIKSVGELEFIERIKGRVPKLKNTVLGIGDDCAVLDYTRDKFLLITTDMLVEDVHFDLGKTNAFKVGRKALAVSLSDIVAMAGIPKYCVVSVGVSQNMPAGVLDDFYSGLLKLATEFGVELVGGDTNRAEKFICDVCMVGEVEKKFLARRDGARVGDSIFVTGVLGGSLKRKQYDFIPRVREARALVENFKVHSMIDISDGLSLDLHHITDSSKVGAVIYGDSIPVSREASSKKEALSGGEDFELLFTTPPRVTEEALRRLGVPVKKIGEIVPKAKGVTIGMEKGRKTELQRKGFRHF